MSLIDPCPEKLDRYAALALEPSTGENSRATVPALQRRPNIRRTIIAILAALLTQVLLPGLFAADPIDAVRQPEAGSELSRLRFTQFGRKPFPWKYKGIRDGKVVLMEASPSEFPIEVPGRKAEVTRTFAVGDEVPDTQYVIARITPKTPVNKFTGFPEDFSEIEFRHARTHAVFVLRIGKINDPPQDWIASLESSDRRVRFTAEIGDRFDFPKRSRFRYEVLDIQPTHVLLLQVNSGGKFRITKSQPAP
jgi:hypothetical protein